MEKLKLLISSCRGMIRCAATAVLLTVGMAAAAQTVSISPKTGNVISAASYGSESHVKNYGGVWIHNQLPMILITSDEATITAAGLMKVHANNVSAIEKENKLTFISGQGDIVNYMSLSLPKGYRFTSYKMVINSNDASVVATNLREMDASFTTEHTSVSIARTGSKGVTMQRTSMNNSDMGNILYFKQEHPYADRGNSTIDVVSFVVTFECTDKFNELLHAGVTGLANPVSCIALPFQTHRTDLGEIEETTKQGYKSYKYNYQNVKDLSADFLLYDQAGVVGGTAVAGTAGDGAISSVYYNGQLTFVGLKNNTYWLETPTDAITQNGTRTPVGYRIVGARLLYANNAQSIDFQKGDNIYITDGDGKYMNASLKFTNTKVEWTYGADGKVSTKSNGNQKVYLLHKIKTNFWGEVTSVSLATTWNRSEASVYNDKGLYLFYGSGEKAYIISHDASGNAVYDKDPKNNAVVVNANPTTGTSTGFTIKLFDKTGEAIAHQAQVDANHVEGELLLTKINNDAIKLQIEGLEEGQEAFVCFQVQLEALNPYIDKMDITCTQPSGEQALKKQYLADDFTIGTDGKVDFGVPSNFGTTGLRFAFDGLHSKSADETYPAGQVGKYSRYHFVKSDYYNLIAENLQGHRSDAANYDYTKKVRVDVAGDKAFHCNNSDKFKAGTTGSGTFYYEEYRYSNDAYNTQGGQWKEMVANNGDNYVKRYLVVCDETRYNIAPTTTPRHAIYAYYSTDLKLTTVDYKPEITYTKVYDDAVIPTGPDKNYYVGATLRLKDKAGSLLPEGTGYAYTKQIIDQINADIAAHKTNAPVDANHILYFDASNVNSLLFSSNNAAWGQLEDLKSKLGMNALIFLPTGVTDNHDNVASKSLSGDDFIAENNIVLEDQWPFFSPYDIRINAANEVSYKRFVANNNDTKKWVSIVMPFTVAINAETGQYTNEDDKCDFTFYQMNATNAFSKPNSSGDLIFTDIDGHFSPYAGVSTTQPNDAYIVRIDRAEMTEKEAKLMFILRQRGSTIVKTPMGRTIQGAASSGTVDGQNMDLIPQATFSGAEVDKMKPIFYFNKDKFVSSLALEGVLTVYVLPFRSYYDCTGTVTRNISHINISLEPNNDPTDIQEVTSNATNAGFVFSSQAGQLTVKATKDLRVNVRNVSGQTIDVKALKAGESHSVKLPSGIYVVNGTKVMVR